MSEYPVSYLASDFEGRPCEEKGGMGVFARTLVKAGSFILAWGGTVLPTEEVYKLPEKVRMEKTVQIDEGLYLVTFGAPGPADFVNHSCNPNAGLRGQIVLVALRDIQPGEEVCFDYATSDGSPYCEFECECGAPQCRKRITGEDWQRPELWERYAGHFSPYLQRRIERLKE